jgi:uncharacterized membrane protein (UPF0182 family)
VAQAIRGNRRRWLIALGVAVVVVVITLNILSGFYVDLLWFREVHFSSVFWTIFWSKVVLGLIFGVVFFAILFANLLIVRRLTPPFRVFTPEQEVIERYRVAVEPYVKWILPAFSALVALFVGIGASSEWRNFLLWRNSGGVSFHTLDPQFHKDPAFYVFRLPFLHFVQGWLFSALVGITVIVAIAHYLWGGIRLQATGERVTPQVKAHLSVLLGLIVLVKAWGYWLGRFDLVVSGRGVGTGASYTDVHAQLPALTLLVFVSIACAIAFLVNIRFRGWALPAIALGLLVVASIVAGGILPAAIQRFSVAPQQLQREEPFIARNIHATRVAFQLRKIQSQDLNPASDLTSADLSSNQSTVSNIRLWQPLPILKDNYDQLQRIRQYYEFQDVDVDRYQLGNAERMVMISAREVSQNGIPGNAGTWQNRHLVYTHGFGAVASQVNTATTEGQPDFILHDIPPKGQLHLNGFGKRVYYGEREDVPFVLVDSQVNELDYQEDSAQKTAPAYSGPGGIKMGGFFGRLLFAWRYKDINLLISSLIHGDSRIMIFRDISERIPKAAPFLQYDADPYAAIVDGRLVWIQDAYTTTDNYPYSQRLSLGSATQGDLSGQINYMRNSVKVVVDAYSGQMKYYVADPTDPIIQVWENAFPDLFTPFSQASPDLQAHFRYPEDLLMVQAQQFARYHVLDPTVFYGNQDAWAIATDPNTTISGSVGSALRPYYVITALPGNSTEEFSLILPFTPAQRNNMVAWMAARSDPQSYGQLVSFEFPSGTNVDGPLQIFNRINSNPDFSSFRTLVNQQGSNLVFGNFLVIPISNGFLYVDPVFVQGAQEGSFPELKRVLVVHGGTVGLGNDLAGAIANSFNQAPPVPPSGGGGGTGPVNKQVAALLAQAVQHFQAADAALKAGDLGTYQKEIQIAQTLIEQANALASKSGTTPTPTPTPSAPTPSPTAS